MAVVAETRPAVTLVEATPAADPAPLGLAAFALTTFLLSGHNATWIPDLIWVGPALFYGGVCQLLAGMWEYRNRNVFGATAFSTYGGFWLSLGIVIVLANISATFAKTLTAGNVFNALAWFLFAFAIFNTYMMLWATRVNAAVFGVFLTLEITEIVLAIGFWQSAHIGKESSIVHLGGWIGVITAAVAWYTSAAGVVNGMSPRTVLPVGRPLWGVLPGMSRADSPMPRRTEV